MKSLITLINQPAKVYILYEKTQWWKGPCQGTSFEFKEAELYDYTEAKKIQKAYPKCIDLVEK